ncbi:MAG: hypothetical protein KatS3mg035_1066 [Bacteroidia bacterium]|nr:MAG: hypothetical protein KatS3mg035_1066 [Bacteroidia bacterium]
MLFILIISLIIILLGEFVSFFQKIKSKEVCLHKFFKSKSNFVKRLFKKTNANRSAIKSNLTI